MIFHALITARGGSTGIKKKNLQNLNRENHSININICCDSSVNCVSNTERIFFSIVNLCSFLKPFSKPSLCFWSWSQ